MKIEYSWIGFGPAVVYAFALYADFMEFQWWFAAILACMWTKRS